jgi:hypothetical protein
MKEFLEGFLLDRRRFLIEFNWSHGNGYSPRRLLHHVYFMSDVLSLLIV